MVIELFFLLIDLIYDFIMVPFAVWNILYLIVKLFHKKNWIVEVDEYAIIFIKTFGLIYFLCLLLGSLMIYFDPNSTSENLEYVVGRRWVAHWLNSLIWVSCSQLFRFKFIRDNSLLRLLISIVFLVSLLQYTIIVTTIARGYPNIDYSILPDFVHYLYLIFKGLVFTSICKLLLQDKDKREAILDDEG